MGKPVKKQPRTARSETSDYQVQPGEPMPLPVTELWQKAVERRLRYLKMTRADLADHIGCSKAAISQLMTASRQSKLVPAVNEALGWVAAPVYRDEESTKQFTRDELIAFLAKELSDPLTDMEPLTPLLISLTVKEMNELGRSLYQHAETETLEYERATAAEREARSRRASLEIIVHSRRNQMESLHSLLADIINELSKPAGFA